MFRGKKEQARAVGGMLTGEAIRKRGIITRDTESSWRAASYDLRIGKLIDPSGKVVSEYVLPPRGIVEVISRERIAVPEDLSGSAMVKTSLCNQGILALGIGLIDPGWDGPISSFLINFGKSPKMLGIDDVFLRTTFHTLDGPQGHVRPVRKEDHEITRERQNATVSLIGGSFLNLEEVLATLEKSTAVRRGVELIAYVTVGGLVLALLGFFLTWFTSNMAGKPETSTMVVSQPLAAEINELRNENADLRRRTASLEAARREDRNGAGGPL